MPKVQTLTINDEEARRLDIPANDAASIIRLVHSRLDISLERVLGSATSCGGAPASGRRAHTRRRRRGTLLACSTSAPRFLWSTASQPLALAPADAARVQLERHRDALQVSSAAIDTLVTVRTVTTHSGTTVTTFRNVLGGIELHGHDTNVLLRADRSLVAIGGAPFSG